MPKRIIEAMLDTGLIPFESRSFCRRLIGEGKVEVDGKEEKDVLRIIDDDSQLSINQTIERGRKENG